MFYDSKNTDYKIHSKMDFPYNSHQHSRPELGCRISTRNNTSWRLQD
jgi:hypothetical protein